MSPKYKWHSVIADAFGGSERKLWIKRNPKNRHNWFVQSDEDDRRELYRVYYHRNDVYRVYRVEDKSEIFLSFAPTLAFAKRVIASNAFTRYCERDLERSRKSRESAEDS